METKLEHVTVGVGMLSGVNALMDAIEETTGVVTSRFGPATPLGTVAAELNRAGRALAEVVGRQMPEVSFYGGTSQPALQAVNVMIDTVNNIRRSA